MPHHRTRRPLHRPQAMCRDHAKLNRGSGSEMPAAYSSGKAQARMHSEHKQKGFVVTRSFTSAVRARQMRGYTAAFAALLLVSNTLILTGPSVGVAPPTTSESRARLALATDSAVVQGSPGDAYQLTRSDVDPDGTAHVRFNRTCQGLPVIGGDFVLHQDRTGNVKSVSISLNKPITASVNPTTSAGSQRPSFPARHRRHPRTGKPDLGCGRRGSLPGRSYRPPVAWPHRCPQREAAPSV